MILVFLCPKDLQRIYNYKSRSSASYKYNLIKGALGKAEHQKITLSEFLAYEGLTLGDVLQYFPQLQKSSKKVCELV